MVYSQCSHLAMVVDADHLEIINPRNVQMIDELFLYDRDKGLFKEILKLSTVMEGRYHVSPNLGQDLNADNLSSFINDPKYGLKSVDQKYPLAICITPRSRYVRINSQRWEEYFFSVYFLTKTYAANDQLLKMANPDTNTSGHHIWFDWQDMKNCADDFMEVLYKQIKRRVTIDTKEVLLKTLIQMEPASALFSRITMTNNDQLSGVNVKFSMMLYSGECGVKDYPANVDGAVVIPPFIIHQPHKQ